jgi:Protein of unknown function (DUF4239)
MNALTISFLVVVGSIVLSLSGMLVVRKLIPLDQSRAHHEVAGYLLGVVGTLYAVLLGLVVVDVQAKYQQAAMMAETEADAAADLFHLADSFPDKQRQSIQETLHEYVTIILEKEWNEKKGATHEASTFPIRRMWTTLNSYEPVSNHEQQCYAQALVELTQLADSRRYRLVVSAGCIPPILWAVLVSGGVLTVLFTYFFSVESVRAHMIMTTMLVTCLSLNVLLVVLYSNPYEGDLKVQPQGFTYDARVFSELLQHRTTTKN